MSEFVGRSTYDFTDDLGVIIQQHRAKKLKSLSETTSRYLDRYVWFEDKTKILVLSPHDSVTGMRTWIAQGVKYKR
jgi:hypothetical protein